MKLYVGLVSGNTYKVRILMALLGIECPMVALDFERREHKSPEFLRLNPRGEVPVLVDGDTVLWDSSACLLYLAERHGGAPWLPAAPGARAEVTQWMALAGGEIQFGLQLGRRGVVQGRWTLGDLERCQAMSRVALDAMEFRLVEHTWLVGDHPTLADIACFPYVETAPESKVPLEPYPGVRAWLDACRALPRWPGRAFTV